MATATLTTPDGKTIVYLRRRFVPASEQFALVQEHTVTDADRLDNLSAQYLGDPELFWRLCDAKCCAAPGGTDRDRGPHSTHYVAGRHPRSPQCIRACISP